MLARVMWLGFIVLCVGVVATRSEFSTPNRTGSKVRALIIDGQNNHDWKTTTPLLRKALGIERPVHGRRGHVAAGRARHERLPAEVRRLRRRREQLQRRALAGRDGSKTSRPTWRAAVDSSPCMPPTIRSPIGPRTTALSGSAAGTVAPRSPARSCMSNDSRLDGARQISLAPAAITASSTNFKFATRDAEHPIMRGLPTVWMHTKDELYDSLRGPAEGLHILATAYSAPEAGRHRPPRADAHDARRTAKAACSTPCWATPTTR